MSTEIGAQQRASGNMSPNRSFLSISDGSSGGAFGAGILFGWTAAGTRPEFTVGTGISTGSLIAPCAFLGQPYDQNLRAAYSGISGKDIYKKKGVLGKCDGSASLRSVKFIHYWLLTNSIYTPRAFDSGHSSDIQHHRKCPPYP